MNKPTAELECESQAPEVIDNTALMVGIKGEAVTVYGFATLFVIASDKLLALGKCLFQTMFFVLLSVDSSLVSMKSLT